MTTPTTIGNLVHETSASTGAANLTLTAVNGKQRVSQLLTRFSLGFGDNGANNPILFISNRDAAEWWFGPCYLSDANTLVRGTTVQSSNADANVTFSAGVKDISNDFQAADLLLRGDPTSSFHAHKNGTQQDFTTATAALLTFGTEEFDVGAEFASSIFTASNAGKYLPQCAARVTAFGTGTTAMRLHLYKNGALYKTLQQVIALAGLTDITLEGSAVVDLAAGDTLKIFVEFAGLAAGTATVGGAAADTWFSCVRVSDARSVNASETVAGVVELATTTEAVTGTDTSRAVTPAGLTAAIEGKQTIWIPANAMIPATTNGPAAGTVEQATNKNMTKTLDFDATTSEIAQFFVAFPKSWNLGTVTFIPHWTAASGSGTFISALSGVAISNDDPLDVAFGTAQSSTDTLLAAYDNHVGPESAAITIAGTPAVGDLVNFKLVRDVADTLAVDVKLIGIQLIYTTNAATDA